MNQQETAGIPPLGTYEWHTQNINPDPHGVPRARFEDCFYADMKFEHANLTLRYLGIEARSVMDEWEGASDGEALSLSDLAALPVPGWVATEGFKLSSAWDTEDGICRLYTAPIPDAQIADIKRIMPAELTASVGEVLGRMCFECITIATALRAVGYQIGTRAEDEQAAVIFWLLPFALEHGPAWREHAQKALDEVLRAHSGHSQESETP